MIYELAIDQHAAVETEEIARLRQQDSAALGTLVERYQHRLYRYLFRLVRDRASAEDLFQQTWLNAVRQIARYDSRRSFDTWLFAIAHNVAMDLLRRRVDESFDEPGTEAPIAEPEALAGLLTAERSSILAGEIAQLPAPYREALTLRFEEGMKIEEIAEVTHAPLSTAKSRVQRALEMLRRKLCSRYRKEDLI